MARVIPYMMAKPSPDQMGSDRARGRSPRMVVMEVRRMGWSRERPDSMRREMLSLFSVSGEWLFAPAGVFDFSVLLAPMNCL